MEQHNIVETPTDLNQPRPDTAQNHEHVRSTVAESLEIESTHEPEPDYPTGTRFAVVSMALALSFLIVGLVDKSEFSVILTTDGTSGQQHPIYRRSKHNRLLQDHCRYRLVLFSIAFPLYQSIS